MTIATDEIFGPVLSIIKVASAEKAFRVANDTEYGLAASIFTANIGKAHRIARDVQAGTVTINCYGEGDITTPFGGFKLSGFGGRDKSLHAHDQYTELKTIWADISDPKARAWSIERHFYAKPHGYSHTSGRVRWLVWHPANATSSKGPAGQA